jgi:hypothetical protein
LRMSPVFLVPGILLKKGLLNMTSKVYIFYGMGH